MGPRINPKDLTRPVQLIGEGDTDAEFVQSLTVAHSVDDVFDFHAAGGKHGFEAKLRALQQLRGWRDVKAVVIVSDNDDDPATALADRRKQAGRALAGVAWPEQSWTLADGSPAVSFVMLPGPNETGCLETLLREIAWRTSDGDAGRECVEEFARCTGVNDWSPSEQAKMRWHALVAGLNRADPGQATRYLLQKRGDVFDFQHPRLQGLAAFLRSVAERC